MSVDGDASDRSGDRQMASLGLLDDAAPIIDVHPRGSQECKTELAAEEKRHRLLGLTAAEQVRYRERTTVERVNARLKDEFGGRTIRVRSHATVFCHLMFDILVLAADQILRLIR